MRNEDKKAAYAKVSERLNATGMVTPTLMEGQAQGMDTVRDIETITGEILEAKRIGGEAVLTIGRGLIEAKSMLDHGEWLPWLTERVEFSERSAQNFMRLAREWSNPQTLADLGASKALALLALPESERDEFVAENNVIDMSARQLEKAIKERDEARKAAEQAQADSRAAVEERQSLMESIKAANALLDLAKADKEQAAGRVTELERQLAELKAKPTEVAVMAVDQEKLDQARAEGAAAKAEEIAQLQAKLDKEKEAKKKADEKRRNAEAAAKEAQEKLEAAEKAERSAAAQADPDVAMLRVCLEQGKTLANTMRGALLKFRNRGDHENAAKTEKLMCAVGEAMKEAAK